jgi:hypothetical protein
MTASPSGEVKSPSRALPLHLRDEEGAVVSCVWLSWEEGQHPHSSAEGDQDSLLGTLEASDMLE